MIPATEPSWGILIVEWTVAALLGIGLIAEVISRIWLGRKKGISAVEREDAKAREELIALLKQQNDALRQQLVDSDADHKRERGEWKEREGKLECRIERLEIGYDELVRQVRPGDVCVNAPSCNDYDPGDRRQSAPTPKPNAHRSKAAPAS